MPLTSLAANAANLLPANPKPKLFLSYSPRDAQAVAERLHASLSECYHVWQDIHDIRRGWPWDEEIEAGLRSSKAVVYLLTPQSVRERGSPGNRDNTDSVCRDELSFARDHHIPIVPVRVLPCDTPLLIHRLQHVDFQRWQESVVAYETGFQRICETIDAVLRGEKRERAWGRLSAPWDFEPFLREKLRDFTGREWLFAEIRQWLAKGAEKALLITGDPGVGKSAVVAALVRNNSNGQVLAYHCCRADTKATTDPAVFVRSLAAMLAARLDGYEAMLEAPEISRLLDKADEDPASAFEAAILGPLAKLPAPETGPRYLLIDALDEALARERRPTIVEVLSTRLDRLPPWLRIVATTRRDPAVLDHLKGLEARSLETQDPRNLDDVRRFVIAALSQLELRRQAEATGRQPGDIAEGFLKSSAGNFLVVSTTLEAVRRGQITLAQAEVLPPELDALYRTFFDRLFVEAGVDFKPSRALLEIALAAQEPLRRRELAATSGLDESYDLGPLLDRLAAFLPARDGCHAVFHKSLADWLTGRDAVSGRPKAGPYHAEAEKGQGRLADWCWGEYQPGAPRASLYCLRHLPTHLAETGRQDQLKKLLLDFNWLQAKLNATDAAALLPDFDHVKGGEELGLLQSAIRLSSHAVGSDKNQLASQLIGRLSNETSPLIQRLVTQTRAWRGAPWLRPLNGNLHPPGTALRRTLLGHSGSVDAVAITPDGRQVVSGGYDQTLRVWDLKSGRVLRTLEGHAGEVQAVALSADGRQAVSASKDHTLKVWDLESGRELRTLEGHADWVTAVAFCADRRRAVSVARDLILKVWDLESGCALRTLELQTNDDDWVELLALSPDGRLAVSSSHGHTLLVWDVESRRNLWTLEDHADYVTAFAFCADGSRAVSASGNHTLNVWDLGSGKELRRLEGHAGRVRAMALSSDGRLAVTGCENHTLKVWDLESGKELRRLEGHGGEVIAVSLSPDGRLVVSGALDQTLRVWDIESKQSPPTPAGHAHEVMVVGTSEDGQWAVSGSDGGTLKVWNLPGGRELRTLEGGAGWVKSVALSPDGRQAVCASFEYPLKVWNVESGRVLWSLRDSELQLRGLALSPDGARVVCESEDHTLIVCDMYGRLLRKLVGHCGEVVHGTMSAGGRRVASLSLDPTGMPGISHLTFKMWNVESGREMWTREAGPGWPTTVALSADGRRGVSGAGDHTVKVWDVESGCELRTLEGHAGEVRTVALSPDGRRAVSGALDHTVKVWDVEGEHCLATFTGESVIKCCALASDGGTIAAGEMSGRVHFLRLVLPDDPVEDEEPGRKKSSLVQRLFASLKR